MWKIRTPTVLQMEATECGAACLAIILRYYGRFVPLLEVREACGVTRDGSSAVSLKRAASLYGLETKAYQMDIDHLRKVEFPVILFWEFNHYVVLESFRPNRVAINDPALGRRSVTFDSFSSSFTGVVLDLKPGPSFKRGGKLASSWHYLLKQVVREWPYSLFTLSSGFLLILPKLSLPVFTQIYIDQVWNEGMLFWLKPMLWIMVLMIGFQILADQLHRMSIRILSSRLDSQTASKYVRHVLTLPDRFFSQRYSGDISGRIILTREVAVFTAEKLLPQISGLALLLLYLVLALSYSPIMGAVVITMATLNALVVLATLRRQKDSALQLQKDAGKAEAALMAALQDIPTLKSSGIERDVFSRYAGHKSRVQNQRLRLNLTQSSLGLLPEFLGQINTLSILIIGFFLIMNGGLTLGMLLAAQQIVAGLKQQIDGLISFVDSLPMIQSSILRLEDVFEHPIDPILQQGFDSHKAWHPTRAKLSGRIDCKSLSYSFSPVSSMIINNISLSIRPGQRIAIVGSSGSGKTTLAKLFAGLLQPTDGKILFDGLRHDEVPRPVRVASIAMVQQDIAIYGMSVRDNLTLWQPVSSLSLKRACIDAQIYDLISRLPNGFDTVLADAGKDLSGGQRQLLEIARALLRDPAILILDEATSSLDAQTERNLDIALRRMSCTQIVIAHRLSTIKSADLILVLDSGSIIQSGTHEQLLDEAGSLYARLVADGEIK
jgi:NHLM bacteriocin system ABC transporter peptidase/ATP-binding protein